MMLRPCVTRADWRERALGAPRCPACFTALRWLLEAGRLAPGLDVCPVEATCWTDEPPWCVAAPVRSLNPRAAGEPPHPPRRRPPIPIAMAQGMVALRRRRRAKPATREM